MLNEKDLVLMYDIQNMIKVNWIYVIKDHMLKSKRLTNYIFPYVVLILKFLKHFGVDLDGESSEVIK